ncbi:MAG: OmpA family protein [Gammaproteobacteria bacterium]|nr:OmpA family protein [Gammaproteobacteria bacterium]
MGYDVKYQRRNNTPVWMVTFADMMALLLTFFIIMLSFSTMDLKKYKAVSSAIEQSFGQGQPHEENTSAIKPIVPLPEPEPKHSLEKQLLNILQKEISEGVLFVERQDQLIIIRFPEQIAFSSASDRLRPEFSPLLEKIVSVVTKSEGEIVVTGHTDKLPINTERFRSNWDLSAARAVSVVHAMLEHSQINPKRMTAQGMADTRPLDAAENTASNRRVEISIREIE